MGCPNNERSSAKKSVAKRSPKASPKEALAQKYRSSTPTGWVPTKFLGEGSYGVVLQVQRKGNPATKAMKIMNFTDDGDEEAAEREIEALSQLARCSRVVQMQSYRWQEKEAAQVIMEEMAKDLCSVLALLTNTGKLSKNILTSLCLECAESVHCCHTGGVMHRDIKPENFLCSREGDLKICDFGLATTMPVDGPAHSLDASFPREKTNPGLKCQMRCACADMLAPEPEHLQRIAEMEEDLQVFQHERAGSENVITCYYRPPELILGVDPSDDEARRPLDAYTAAVDIWALGCVFAEILLKGERLILSEDEVEIACEMFDLFGLPQKKEGYKTSTMPLLQEALDYYRGDWQHDSRRVGRSLTQRLGVQNKQIIELISSMLQYDPADRPPIDEVVSHRAFSGVRASSKRLLHQAIGGINFDSESINQMCDLPKRMKDPRSTTMSRFAVPNDTGSLQASPMCASSCECSPASIGPSRGPRNERN